MVFRLSNLAASSITFVIVLGAENLIVALVDYNRPPVPYDDIGPGLATLLVSFFSLFGLLGHLVILLMNRKLVETLPRRSALLIGAASGFFTPVGIIVVGVGMGVVSATLTFLGVRRAASRLDPGFDDLETLHLNS